MKQLQDLDKLAFDINATGDVLGGLSRSRIYELIADGQLRSFTIGTRRFISRDAILELIARQEAAAANVAEK